MYIACTAALGEIERKGLIARLAFLSTLFKKILSIVSLRSRNFKVTANNNSTWEIIRVSTMLLSVVYHLPQWLKLRIAIQ